MILCEILWDLMKYIMKSIMKSYNTKDKNICVHTCTIYTYMYHQIPPKCKIFLVGFPSVLYERPGHNERSVLNHLFLLLFSEKCNTFQWKAHFHEKHFSVKSASIFSEKHTFMKSTVLFMKSAVLNLHDEKCSAFHEKHSAFHHTNLWAYCSYLRSKLVQNY